MNDMLRELAEVVRRMEAIKVANWDVDVSELSATRIAVIDFVHDHHAEIAQNSEAAKRLRALEMAMGEVDGWHTRRFKKRADEIMRGES